MYDTTVTVFNLYSSKQLDSDTWYPHVISGCYFIADKAANIAKTGLENADSAKLHIPYKKMDGKLMIGDLQYFDPKEWDLQPNDLYGQIITFAEGKDFFMVGEYPEEPVNDGDYRGGFFSYLNTSHDNVYRITSAGKYSVIPHFEIGGA